MTIMRAQPEQMEGNLQVWEQPAVHRWTGHQRGVLQGHQAAVTGEQASSCFWPCMLPNAAQWKSGR